MSQEKSPSDAPANANHTPSSILPEDLLGHHHGLIHPHRAFAEIRAKRGLFALEVVLGALASVAALYAVAPIAVIMAPVIRSLLHALALPFEVDVSTIITFGPIAIVAPCIDTLPLRAPTGFDVVWGSVTAVALFLATIPFRERFLPYIYLFRLVIVVVVSSVLLLHIIPPEADDVAVAICHAATFQLLLGAITPLLFSATTSFLAASLLLRLAVPLVSMLHLAVYLPLSVAAIAGALHYFGASAFGLTVMALGYFGPILFSISFYSILVAHTRPRDDAAIMPHDATWRRRLTLRLIRSHA